MRPAEVKEYMPTVSCKNALVSTFNWQEAPLFNQHQAPHTRKRSTDVELDATCEEVKSLLVTKSGSDAKHMWREDEKQEVYAKYISIWDRIRAKCLNGGVEVPLL